MCIRDRLEGPTLYGAKSGNWHRSSSEGVDIMLGTRDAINEWLTKRREKAAAEGRAKGIMMYQAWYDRKQAAEARGEPFDEPPPSANNDSR